MPDLFTMGQWHGGTSIDVTLILLNKIVHIRQPAAQQTTDSWQYLYQNQLNLKYALSHHFLKKKTRPWGEQVWKSKES